MELGSLQPQGLESIAKMFRWAQLAHLEYFHSPLWGELKNHSIYLRSSCCLLFWHLNSLMVFSGGPTFEELSSLVYPNLTTSTLKPEVGPRHPEGVQFVVATI